MLNKKILCASLALIISHIFSHQIHEHHDTRTRKQFLPLGKNKIIDKTITLEFFKDEKTLNNDKDDNHNNPIAIIRYSWTDDRTIIHLDFFKIMSRKNRNKGLGKQLFTYFITYLRKKERKAKKICWTAQALDPEHMSQDKLENFYKSLGGKKLYSERCKNTDCTCPSPTSSQFSLAIDNFILTDTSLLQTMDIIEESHIRRVKKLNLAQKAQF